MSLKLVRLGKLWGITQWRDCYAKYPLDLGLWLVPKHSVLVG